MKKRTRRVFALPKIPPTSPIYERYSASLSTPSSPPPPPHPSPTPSSTPQTLNFASVHIPTPNALKTPLPSQNARPCSSTNIQDKLDSHNTAQKQVEIMSWRM
ncbi:hypothetical protein CC86DRAFT_75612 [Ophiobolus disseminans]|uniref:Uncharacterized protein n=1 Tax=Ophiobolus disseminans TaxID=1469910 RepID=A0A6A6ZPQ1_9PLEO|nr:hypothetical protein CC86DRAFT_75612 [Ophiobolus disseminans]